MRMAVFEYAGGKIAVPPVSTQIFEKRGKQVTMLSIGDTDPFTIQGTFDEALAELNAALSETVITKKQKCSSGFAGDMK
jgi:hypothetical protein